MHSEQCHTFSNNLIKGCVLIAISRPENDHFMVDNAKVPGHHGDIFFLCSLISLYQQPALSQLIWNFFENDFMLGVVNNILA